MTILITFLSLIASILTILAAIEKNKKLLIIAVVLAVAIMIVGFIHKNNRTDAPISTFAPLSETTLSPVSTQIVNSPTPIVTSIVDQLKSKQENMNTDLKSVAADEKRFNGHFYQKGETVEYVVESPQHGLLWVDFYHDNPLVNVGASGYELSVVNPNGNIVYSQRIKNSDLKTEIHPIGVTKGNYTVKVSATFYVDDIDFYLNVYYQPVNSSELEPNNSIDMYNTVFVSDNDIASIYGSAEPKIGDSDRDYYKFKVPEDGYISLGIKHRNIGGDGTEFLLDLYDYQQQKIAELKSTGRLVDAYSSKIFLTKGEYYIKVTGYIDSELYILNIGYSTSE